MNAISTPDLTSAFLASRWEAMRDEVSALSSYPADWDGEGADRVPFALVQATLRWFVRLEASGGPVPSVVYPTAGGTPVVEWYSADTSSYVAYVRKPDRVDIVYHLPGGEPVHVVVPLPAKVAPSAVNTPWISIQVSGTIFQRESMAAGSTTELDCETDSSYCQAA